jgi:uncharacterized membrane protein YhaH (DUF805 family)
MSWGEIFFGFTGRINRKAYWLASIAVTMAGLLFIALLAYLATGNPAAPEVWQRPTDKSSVWAPVWMAYFLFLAWPSSALAVKRLQDRDRPALLWYVYYGLSAALTLLPVRGTTGSEIRPAAGAAILVLAIFGTYIMFELGILRGTPGQNRHGADPMPPGYYGGDFSFWSWMLALEGRISRAKWWLGFAIVIGTIIGASLAAAFIFSTFAGQHPELERNLSDPIWLKSKEAAPLLFRLGLWTMAPLFVILLASWSLVALGVKRLHDRGLSSWLILVVVLPFLGALLAPSLAQTFEAGENFVPLAFLLFLASAIWSVLQFGIFKGETGSNSEGPDPLAGRS